MSRKYFILIFAFLFAVPLVAQEPEDLVGAKEEVKLFYRTEWVLGAILHTRGWGGYFRYGQHLTGTKKRLWTLDVLAMKHPKEIKINVYGNDAKGYKYGKLNTFTNVRIGIGRQRTIFGKEIQRGVEINMVYTGGFSIGFLKPVYLVVLEPDPNGELNKVTVRYDPELHTLNNIYGRAPITKGIGEMKVIPGIHARLAFNFEFAKEDYKLQMIEVGTVVDAFYKEVEIMYDTYNYQFWWTFYVSYQFGQKKK